MSQEQPERDLEDNLPIFLTVFQRHPSFEKGMHALIWEPSLRHPAAFFAAAFGLRPACVRTRPLRAAQLMWCDRRWVHSSSILKLTLMVVQGRPPEPKRNFQNPQNANNSRDAGTSAIPLLALALGFALAFAFLGLALDFGFRLP